LSPPRPCPARNHASDLMMLKLIEVVSSYEKQ
jgi:hypothetical protein